MYDNYSVNELKNIFALQESLIVFQTNDLNEFRSFIDFLIKQLSVRQRPRCLIVHSGELQIRAEIRMTDILKYAWDKKFLNVSVLMTDQTDKTIESSLIYYFNPFNDIVYHSKLNKRNEIFPDKL